MIIQTGKTTKDRGVLSSPLWDKYPEHNTDSEECWCEPIVIYIDPENNNKVILHRAFGG